MDDNRGTIMNRERKRQINEFEGLRWGNITPTDMDGLIDFHNKAWIMMEFKYKDIELPDGQLLAFERQCDDLQKAKPTIFIIGRHAVDPPSDDVYAADVIVDRFRYRGVWYEDASPVTVKDKIDSFLKFKGLL